MAPPSRGASSKRKGVTREARFKKAKAAEMAVRVKGSNKPALGTTSTSSTHSSKGKQRANEIEEDPHPFRYKSFNDRLASVHINVATSLGRSGTGALAGLDGHGLVPLTATGSAQAMEVDGDESSDGSEDDFDNSTLHAKTSFGVALQTWRELNLSLPYTSLAQRIQPLSLSLPLLLHHQATITTSLEQALLASYPDSYLAYEPALDLIPRLAADLGSAFLPSYPTLVSAILRTSTINKLNTGGQEYTAATIVERSFESLAAVLRCMAPFVLREAQSKEGQAQDWLVTTWALLRPYIGWQGVASESLLSVPDPVDEDGQARNQVDDRTDAIRNGRPKRKTVPAHTRRFASEAFAHLVRRAKSDQLRRISSVTMDDVRISMVASDTQPTQLATFSSGVAGVWAEVAKSVEGRIHSMAPAHLDAALTSKAASFDSFTSQARIVIGTFIVTALCHHAQSDSLVPIFVWLADLFEARLEAIVNKGQDEEHIWQLREASQWMIAFVGTRKGKRVDDTVKGRLFSLLARTASFLRSTHDELAVVRASVVQLIAIALPIARIQDLIGPVVKTMDLLAPQSSQEEISSSYSCTVVALAEMEFSGYQQVVLPSIVRVTSDRLDATEGRADDALELLYALDQHKVFDLLASQMPSAAAVRWQVLLARAVQQRIEALIIKLRSSTRFELANHEVVSLSLAKLLRSHETQTTIELLCDVIVASTATQSDIRQLKDGFDASPFSPTALICTALQSLTVLMSTNDRNSAAKAVERLSGSFTLDDLLIRHAWHRLFVVRFAQFVVTADERGSRIALGRMTDLIEVLGDSASSADEELRLAAVQILSLAERGQKATSEGGAIFAQVVEIERKGLSVETLRERNVLMRAVARGIVHFTVTNKDADRPAWYVKAVCLVIRSLTSTMKLNLRPLWEESRRALVDLSAQYGQDVWSIAFTELAESQTVSGPPQWNIDAGPMHHHDIIEQTLEHELVDKQFKDPQLADRKDLVGGALKQTDGMIVKLTLQRDQLPAGRLDLINYHVQILALFSSIVPLVERNNAAFMEHFFSSIVDRTSNDEEDEEEDVEGSLEDVQPSKADDTLILSRNQRREQLCAYLETFAQFSNPKALYRSGDLHGYLYKLCTQGDLKVQRLAVDVILQWKDPAHTANAAMMKNLLDPAQFREQLTSLVLANTAESSIQPGHRASLMPLLLRILYGIIISKQSRGSGQANRKSSILTSLADLEADELRGFVDVMLEPFPDIRDTMDTERGRFDFNENEPRASRRVQIGFTTLLEDVIKHLGLRLLPVWTPLLNATLNITYHASLSAAKGQGKATQAQRALRQGGLRRLNDFFRVPTSAFDWQPFLPATFANLISPRLPALRTESIQSPSTLLDIVHTWSGKANTLFFLVEFDKSLLSNVLACLRSTGVKPSVINRILDVVENIIAFSEGGDEQDTEDHSSDQVCQSILRPNITTLLSGLDALARRCNTASQAEAKAMGRDELLRRVLQALAKLAGHVKEPSDVTSLFALLGPLLRKGNTVIPEKSKANVLLVFDQLIPTWFESKPESASIDSLHEALSALFSRLRTRPARATLCQTYSHLAEFDTSLQVVARCAVDLNSYDTKRMQEYDFDRRLEAFDSINGSEAENAAARANWSPRQWMPLLHNFVFFIQDHDELAIRASAGTALRKFIDTVATNQGDAHDDNVALERLFTQVVFAGLRRGLRSFSELVKREVIQTLGYAIAQLDKFAYLAEMRGLLVEGDEEANFFNNIQHIQVHRRVRALVRLGQEAQLGHFKSRTIIDVFLPLVEYFLRADSNTDGNLLQQALDCLGQLTGQLNWGPYNVLLWKYLSFKRDKDQEEIKVSEKVSVRAAMSILDNFHFDMDEDLVLVEDTKNTEEEHDGLGDDASELDETRRDEAMAHSRKVLDAVRHRLLPKLMECLDLKDDMDDAVRLPIAVGIARVLLRLPVQHRRSDIIRLLNTMAHVFRSKSQDTRNLARTTLSKVAITLGPAYFPNIITELRKILTRGPQIAVLAFTVHNLLLHCVESAHENALKVLQDGTSDVMDVVVEDIFGRTAEDRQSIENRTTYREVKSSKSLDTLEQVARIVHPSSIRDLLVPLKELMRQTEAVQATRHFDDCLRRIAVGLQTNVHLDVHEYLVLCHSLLSNNNFLHSADRRQSGKSKSVRKLNAVLSKRHEIEQGPQRDHLAHNSHRFVAFGLDLLFSALRKSKFDFGDPQLLAKLEPLVGAVGNSLYAPQSSIVIQGLRCLTLLVKCPLQSVYGSLPTITKQTLKLIEREGNARSDILMSCLKLITVLIRDVDRTASEEQRLMPEKHLLMLCRLIETNIEDDVEMQGTLFSLLRALVVRKLAVTEVYDLMDKVARMLVVQQSDSVRSTCRATYLDFLLNMPQGKKRFDNQIHFLVKNLDYAYESGRLSVLDFLRSLFDKVADDVLRPYLDLLFVALVMRLANDESAACRERVSALIRRTIDVCRAEELRKFVGLTKSWADASFADETGRNLARVAAMVYTIMMEADVGDDATEEDSQAWQRKAFLQSVSILETCADHLELHEFDTDDEEEGAFEEDSILSDWQLPYQSLQLVTRIFKSRSKIWSDESKVDVMAHFDKAWVITSRLLLFPHAWVRLAACRLLGEHFSYQSAHQPGTELKHMVNLCKKLSLILRSPQIDEPLSLQVVKNLVYIGKCFAFVDALKEAKEAPGNRNAIVEAESDDEEPRAGTEAGKNVVDVEADHDDSALWQEQPLRWLFNRLSHQLRRSGTERAYLAQGAFLASNALLKWMAAMMSQLEASMCERYLVHVIAPLYRIIESSVGTKTNGDAGPVSSSDAAGAARRESLQALATEVQDLLQAKVGTQAYAAIYATVKRKAMDKRQQRRAQTIQRGIDFPEQMMARKVQRNQRKHESRKRKANTFAKAKERVRPSKRQR